MFKTCPRLYYYTIIEGWGSTEESVHLRFGQEYHKALEDFDKLQAQGEGRTSALKQVVLEAWQRTADWSVDEDTRAGKYKNRRTLLRTIVDYLDYYHEDNAKTYIKADGAPAVELSFRFELDWGPALHWGCPEGQQVVAITDETGTHAPQPYLLCGHLDRVVSFNDDLFVMDRKTTTSTPSGFYFDQYQPNNQMTLYTLASQVILGSPVKGVIIDAAQILVESSRFVRGITYRTPDQLEEWVQDLHHWFALAESYAVAGYWPQNDVSCGLYGGCRFREVCSKSPQVRGQFLKSHFTKLPQEERWNPLRPR